MSELITLYKYAELKDIPLKDLKYYCKAMPEAVEEHGIWRLPKDSMLPNRLLKTVKEAANEWMLSERTVLKLIREGKIKCAWPYKNSYKLYINASAPEIDYLTTSDVAIRWLTNDKTKLSTVEREVRRFANKGRIKGAYFDDHKKCWQIPFDAKKPLDARIKTGEYAKANKINILQTLGLINTIHKSAFIQILEKTPSQSINLVLGYFPSLKDKADKKALDKVLKHLKRIITPDGLFVLFLASPILASQFILAGKDTFSHKFPQEKLSRRYKDEKGNPLRVYEDVCVFSHKKIPVPEQFVTLKKFTKAEEKKHLTNDPNLLNLTRNIIKHYLQQKSDSTILSLACPDATFIVAAILEGHNFIGSCKKNDISNAVYEAWKKVYKKKHISFTPSPLLESFKSRATAEQAKAHT